MTQNCNKIKTDYWKPLCSFNGSEGVYSTTSCPNWATFTWPLPADIQTGKLSKESRHHQYLNSVTLHPCHLNALARWASKEELLSCHINLLMCCDQFLNLLHRNLPCSAACAEIRRTRRWCEGNVSHCQRSIRYPPHPASGSQHEDWSCNKDQSRLCITE